MVERIQRKRTKGWRMPEGAIYVGRPTRYGNPFTVGRYFRNISGDWYVASFGDSPHFGNEQVKSLADSLRLFRNYAEHRARRGWVIGLAGKNLACWCPLDRPCHADILLQLANAELKPEVREEE